MVDLSELNGRVAFSNLKHGQILVTPSISGTSHLTFIVACHKGMLQADWNHVAH